MLPQTLKERLRSAFSASLRGQLSLIGRWTFLYISIGLIAGAASIVFYFLCQLGMRVFLDFLAGYRPPAAHGEFPLFPPGGGDFTRWVLLVLPAGGGLLSGWLVYRYAPQAAGGGNDAAIHAYHHSDGCIPARVPLIKAVATAVTITTGGSGGREGPIAQIGAGLGSLVAVRLGLSARERRILMAAGIAAGVGSIFRAPLAGALFAAEFLYRDAEFEYEVIIPAGMASVVAYCLFCSVYGWGSLLESPGFVFRNPLELGPYLILALVVAGAGVLFIRVFHATARLFSRLRVPNHLKPAIGGFLTGIIGFFLPHTLSFGYGYAQQAIHMEVGSLFLLSLALGKIFTTSFSIGSGGSGGLFGPSIIIGAALGGVVGQSVEQVFPGLLENPGAFVVVGMAGFFAAVSNTPISTIIFVSEMTNSHHLLLPSLLVCSLAFLAARGWALFPSQVRRRIDSPAHAGEFFFDLLETITVADLKDRVRRVMMIPEEMRFVDFKRHFAQSEQHYFPVKDSRGKLARIFSINDVRSVLFEPAIEELVVMRDIGSAEIIFITPSEDLNSVLKKFTVKNIDSLPVVADTDHAELIGMLSRREVIAFYNERAHALKSAA